MTCLDCKYMKAARHKGRWFWLCFCPGPRRGQSIYASKERIATEKVLALIEAPDWCQLNAEKKGGNP